MTHFICEWDCILEGLELQETQTQQSDGDTYGGYFTEQQIEEIRASLHVPDDSGYNFRFAFSKLWQGDHEDSIDWVLYNPDGTVAHKKFNKKIVSETEWRYEAWFASGADYYIIENVPAGYRVRYENVGEHASETDRCYNGGTIINYKLPKTGDDANLTLWLGCVLAGLTIVSFAAYAEKRKRAHGK